MNVRPAFLAWLMLACIALVARNANAQALDCPSQPYEYRAVSGSFDTGYVASSNAAAAAMGALCVAAWNAGNSCSGVSGSTANTYTLTGQSGGTYSGPTDTTSTGAFFNYHWERTATGSPSGDSSRPVNITRRNTVTCPAPDECEPIEGQPGTKFTAFDWRDIAAAPNDFCDTGTSCKIKVSQATGIGGVDVWTMEHTAENCTDGAENGPAEIDRIEGEACTPVGDGEYCASPSGDGDCGYLNDKFICFNTVPEDGCKYMSDGSGVCQADAGTPPQPDSGTPGTTATPDDTIEQQTPNDPSTGGGCGAGCNYYDPATVAGSDRDPTDTGGSSGGGTNVGGVGDDVEDEELGELEEPVLADLECEVAGCAETFYMRVSNAPIVAAVSGVGAAIPSGSPPSWTLEAFGEEYSLSAPVIAIWEDMAPFLSVIFLVIYAWVATRIVLSA